MEDSEIYINVKTRITTFGSHDGIIVQYGIQKGFEMFRPYILDEVPSYFSSQRPTLAPNQWPRISDETVNESVNYHHRHQFVRCPQSLVYSYSGKDDRSEENFMEAAKVRLNVFQTELLASKYSSFDTETIPFSCAMFKRKLKSVTPNRCGSEEDNGPSKTMRKIGHYYERSRAGKISVLDENMRVKTTIANCGPQRISNLSNQSYSNTAKLQHSYKTMGINYNQSIGNNDKIPSFNYEIIENKAMENNPMKEIFIAKGNEMNKDGIKDLLNASSSKQSAMNCHAHFYNQRNQHRNKMEPKIARFFRAQTTGSINMEEGEETATQMMFHLYQTHDAFGNVLKQW